MQGSLPALAVQDWELALDGPAFGQVAHCTELADLEARVALVLHLTPAEGLVPASLVLERSAGSTAVASNGCSSTANA